MADEASLRLASIVGVDVAGYSARTEADSTATARQIVAMRTRIADIAARHHGRIFNTAGDGVMLEFAAASDAVEAIFDLLDERPAREPEAHIGAHLGDVTTTENGDLLGHGVNVAARLMAIAPAGRAVISQDLRAAAGSHAKREMRSLGEVALAKMQAKVFAFEIAPDTGAKLAPAASWRSPRNALIAGGVIAALAVLSGVFFLMRSPSEKAAPVAASDGAPTDVANVSTIEQPRVSIAVLPFVNMSSDAEQEYFSDGLSEELMNQLARIDALRVTARTSSFAFKGKNEDLRVIGEKLGVANILEGSVRKAGTRLRITAQLINVSDGSHLWSDTFDRELDDVFAIQDEIATAVASALSVTLGVSTAAHDYGGTKNFAAYDQFLKGRTFTRKGSYEESLPFFREAVRLDPDFGIAWASIATSLIVLQSGPEDLRRFDAERDDAAKRAVVAAPNSRLANSAFGWCEALKGNWSAAELAMTRAMERGTADDASGEGYIGAYLTATGRVREALLFRERARDADPLALELSFALLRQYLMIERWDLLDAEYARSKDLEGHRGGTEMVQLLRLLATKGDEGAVRAQIERTEAASPTLAVHALSEAYPSPSNITSALRSVVDSAPQTIHTNLAVMAGIYGDDDLAIDAIDAVDASTHAGILQRLWFAQLGGARKDPRFKEMMREVGLADFWLKSGKWPDYCGPDGPDDFKCW